MSDNQNPQDDSQEEVDLAAKVTAAAEEAEEKEESAKAEMSEIDKLKEDLEKMTEMARRTMADMQNMKRRQEEESVQLISRANANLIKSLLPALDNLSRALDHIPEGAEKWAEGITMTINQLAKTFEDFGLEPIAAEGEKFNPDLHEAVLQGAGEKDIVIQELEKGYQLGGQVLRHSKVQVGNGEEA